MEAKFKITDIANLIPSPIYGIGRDIKALQSIEELESKLIFVSPNREASEKFISDLKSDAKIKCVSLPISYSTFVINRLNEKINRILQDPNETLIYK